MIKSITVINKKGEELTIELGAPEKSGLWVKSIKGIGPGKADIMTTDFATSDGGMFNSARAETRNITLVIGLMSYIHPTETDPVTEKPRTVSVEEVRRNLYKWFYKKAPITFVIHTDRINLISEGYVESNEPDIFNKQETTSISIICPDPNMYLGTASSKYVQDGINFSSTEDNFEFPMSFIQTADTEFDPDKVYYEMDPHTNIYYVTTDETMVGGKTYYEEDNAWSGYSSNDGYQNLVEDDLNPSITEYFESTDEEFLSGREYYEFDDESDSYFLTPDFIIDPNKTYYKYWDDTLFANILTITEKDLVYSGQIELGIEIVIHITGDVSGLSIYKILDTNSSLAMTFDDQAIITGTGGRLSAGDEIRITTTKGLKSAVLIRNAEQKNILNALGKNPAWFQLDQGINTFSYIAESGSEYVSMDINFLTAYEGV